MDNLLVQSGVVGIFAILVIRELLTFFGKRPSDDSTFPTWIRIQLQQTVIQLSKDMQSQTEAMKEIRDALGNINKTLFGISGEYERIKGTIERIEHSLEKANDRREAKRNGK